VLVVTDGTPLPKAIGKQLTSEGIPTMVINLHDSSRKSAHVLICMLACYLRKAWAPLTFTDENPPAPGNPGDNGRGLAVGAGADVAR
jgi:hypothetical protein